MAELNVGLDSGGTKAEARNLETGSRAATRLLNDTPGAEAQRSALQESLNNPRPARPDEQVIDFTADMVLAAGRQRSTGRAHSETRGSHGPRDPFSVNARFENSSDVAPENRGRRMDTAINRPVHVLSAKEVAALHMPPAAPGEMIVANVNHNHKNYIARIPAGGVSGILAQKEYFNPGNPILDALNMSVGFSAHFQSRYEFNKKGKAVTMVPQDDPTNTRKAVRVHNLVASDEAVFREGGEGFDIFKGMTGHFGYARRLTSLKDKYDDMVVKQGHPVYQYRINPVVDNRATINGKTPAPDSVRQEYLKSALALSDKDYRSYKAGRSVMFNTFDHSCVTGGLETYDQVNKYSSPFQTMVKRNPMFLEKGLLDRGMIDPGEYYSRGGQDLKSEVQSNKHFRW